MGVSTAARTSFLLFWELSRCRERWLRPLAEEANQSLDVLRSRDLQHKLKTHGHPHTH